MKRYKYFLPKGTPVDIWARLTSSLIPTMIATLPTEYDWVVEMIYPPITDGMNDNVFVPYNGFIISTKKENLRKLF